MKAKAILFNGPKVCGKDTAINHLKNIGIDLTIREAKDELHKLTRQFFCSTEENYWEIYNNRVLKEKPLKDFSVFLNWGEMEQLENILKQNLYTYTGDDEGFNCFLSIRQAMIYVSEVICKPRFGNDYFGKSRAGSIIDGEVIVDGSTGFPEELPPLIKRLGQDNTLLIRVHREGCTFDGDSRNWIDDGVINNTVDVYNNGSEEEYLQQVENIVKGFLNDN